MKKDNFFVERDKLFGKLVLKNGTILYLKAGEWNKSHQYQDVITITGLKMVVRTDGVISVNWLERKYKVLNENYDSFLIYNKQEIYFSYFLLEYFNKEIKKEELNVD